MSVGHDISNHLIILKESIRSLQTFSARTSVAFEEFEGVLRALNDLERLARWLIAGGRKGMPGEYVGVDLAVLLSNVVNEARNHTLVRHCAVELTGEKSFETRTDPVMIRQLLLNLILNAAQATDGRGHVRDGVLDGLYADNRVACHVRVDEKRMRTIHPSLIKLTVKPGYQLRNRVYITNAITLQSIKGSVVTVIDGQGTCRCVYIGAAAKLIGFTLTNGAAIGLGSYYESSGGGLCFDYASDAMVSNCVITGNRAEGEGGGVYSALSTVTLQNLLVMGNSAQSSVSRGGGLRASYGSILLIDSVFQQNFSGFDGGGIMLYHTDSTLRNLLLTGNSALRKGGGMTFDGCSPTLENITMVENSSSSGNGGALSVSYASQPTLRNCILWSNTPNQIVFDTDWGGMALTVDHCDVQGGLAGIPTYGLGPVTWLDGNLDTNPLFAAVGDYHLQCISPCINVGTNQDWMIGATDLDGNPRLYAGGRVDMGAYEYQGMSIWSNTTVPGLVDGGPDSAVELGVKFKSDVAGTMKGIRFYKAAANTGVHIGNLWTSNGTRLATATFMSETASGWQQALFATPVTIASNTVYVASYHANNGHYSADLNYFLGKGVDNPPLHVLMNGVFGGNGVYAYGASSMFPNQTYSAANYWVDVVFRASPPPLTSIQVLGTNGAVMVSGEAASAAKGTAFGYVGVGASVTHTLSITNGGNAALTISGLVTNGVNRDQWSASSLPSTIAVGAVSNFTVTFSPSAPGGYSAWLEIANNSTTTPYVVNLSGAAYQFSASGGPYSGGNSITIANGTLGNGSDITNVLVGGVAATIEAQGANWVRITMPAHNMGTVDIVVQSASAGETMLTGAYTYTRRSAADDGFNPGANGVV